MVKLLFPTLAQSEGCLEDFTLEGGIKDIVPWLSERGVEIQVDPNLVGDEDYGRYYAVIADEILAELLLNFDSVILKHPDCWSVVDSSNYPRILAKQIIGVQPMTGPVGEVFRLSLRYGESCK